MECEILEALKKFENHQTSNNMSQELKEKIESFAKEVTKRQDITSANINKRRYQLTSLKHMNNIQDSSNTKEAKADIEKRCARLKKEFQRFREDNLQNYFSESSHSNVYR